MAVLTTTDGAPLLRGASPERAQQSPFRGVVRRSVTIKRHLDEQIVARMQERQLTYSGVLEEALRALLGEQVS